MKSIFQFSLRELLIVVLFTGLGLAALRVGGVLASVTIFIAIIFLIGLAIVAFVGRNRAQAFAIGFVIPVLVYGALVLSVGKSELDPYNGKLPTTKMLLPVFQAMVKQTWTDFTTGQVVPNYDPAKNPSVGGGGGGFGGTTVFVTETPDRTTFMSLAHLLLAMILGYCGAKFAVFVHNNPACAKKTTQLKPGQSEGE